MPNPDHQHEGRRSAPRMPLTDYCSSSTMRRRRGVRSTCRTPQRLYDAAIVALFRHRNLVRPPLAPHRACPLARLEKQVKIFMLVIINGMLLAAFATASARADCDGSS